MPTTTQQRFTALQSGEVDMLARNTTWTLTRDTSLGFDFAGINFYDGQGFMVQRDSRRDLGRGSWTAPRSACSPAPRPS